MNLKVHFFALAENFKEPSTTLRTMLSWDLDLFTDKMRIFNSHDLEITDYDLTILEKGDIDYPYQSSPLDSEKVLKAMDKSPVIKESRANIKVLLLPTTTKLEYTGSSIAGIASPSKIKNLYSTFFVEIIEPNLSILKVRGIESMHILDCDVI